jgi:hypothetical protein
MKLCAVPLSAVNSEKNLGDHDEIAAIDPVRETRKGNAEQGEKDREADTRHEPHLRIAELKFATDRVHQDRQEATVQLIDRVASAKHQQDRYTVLARFRSHGDIG